MMRFRLREISMKLECSVVISMEACGSDARCTTAAANMRRKRSRLVVGEHQNADNWLSAFHQLSSGTNKHRRQCQMLVASTYSVPPHTTKRHAFWSTLVSLRSHEVQEKTSLTRRKTIGSVLRANTFALTELYKANLKVLPLLTAYSRAIRMSESNLENMSVLKK